MIKESISAMSFEHTSWLNGLDFYKNELDGLKTLLTEIAGKYTSKELGADIEQYENQMKVQAENIDILRHDINETLTKSAAQAQSNSAGYIDAELLKEHNRQKERYMSEEKAINELRQGFNRFASKWM